MALIACRECGRQISDLAASCPHCGAPATKAADPVAVVTTQQTGKLFKAWQFVGVAMICGGVVACSTQHVTASGALLAFGALIYAGSRIGAWWRHG